jgi:hypothetical protein
MSVGECAEIGLQKVGWARILSNAKRDLGLASKGQLKGSKKARRLAKERKQKRQS